MTLILYFLRRALRGIAEAPFVNAVAVVTIGISLFVVLVVGGVATQVRNLVGSWATDISLTAYFAEGASRERAVAVGEHALSSLGEETSLTIIEPGEALERLRRSLGQDAGILDGLEENPLPLSIEIRSAALGDGALAARVAREIGAMEGVESVDTGRDWAERLERVLSLVALLGQIVGGMIMLAAAIMVSNTIKLALYARRDEIEIMKLCGATDAFVRAPFLIEGLLQGLAGAILAALVSIVLWRLMIPELSLVLQETFAIPFRPEAPWSVLAWLLVAGSGLGLAGSAISLGRFLRVAA
ncbi:MAG: permease-like cell division protein FtsX [Deltaproteobacteria bacterium]|nr:permease-like cell division protein FtsX [Deltaproteobacteria bacterium]